MSFQVFRVKSAAELDSSPVALIRDYPLEPRDYKPYAQCNLCLSENSLLLRMWAFEVSPPEGSLLTAVLYLFADKPDTALSVTFSPQEGCRFGLYAGEEPVEALTPPPGFRQHPHSGEDLQGVYWGGFAAVALDWLCQFGAMRSESFPGNFYKLCDGPKEAHKGSLFPADFSRRLCAPENMGEFLVVSY